MKQSYETFDPVANNRTRNPFDRAQRKTPESRSFGELEKNYTAKTIATSEVAMPGQRTVLKGLIGHSNSSGDQAPWEWNGENPVLCHALTTISTSVCYVR